MLLSTWQYEYGAPCTDDIDVLAAAALIDRLYGPLEQRTGGPLHAMLDDGNIEDGDVERYLADGERYAYLHDGRYRRWAQAGDAVHDEHLAAIAHTCDAILHLFDGMTQACRAAALGWALRHPDAYAPELAARVRAEPWAAAEAAADELLAAIADDSPKVDRRTGPTVQACAPIPCPPFTHGTYAELFAAEGVARMGKDAQFVSPLDPAAVRQWADDFRARGGIMVMGEPGEGVIDLTGPPLAGNAPEGAPVLKSYNSTVWHADGTVTDTAWAASDGHATVRIHPGEHMRFAPDAKVTGSFTEARVNADGSADLAGPTTHYLATTDGRVLDAHGLALGDIISGRAELNSSIADALAVPPNVRYVCDNPFGLGLEDRYPSALLVPVPEVVTAPEGVDPEAVVDAVDLCREVGLLEAAPDQGVIVLPYGLEFPGDEER